MAKRQCVPAYRFKNQYFGPYRPRQYVLRDAALHQAAHQHVVVRQVAYQRVIVGQAAYPPGPGVCLREEVRVREASFQPHATFGQQFRVREASFQPHATFRQEFHVREASLQPHATFRQTNVFGEQVRVCGRLESEAPAQAQLCVRPAVPAIEPTQQLEPKKSTTGRDDKKAAQATIVLPDSTEVPLAEYEVATSSGTLVSARLFTAAVNNVS